MPGPGLTPPIPARNLLQINFVKLSDAAGTKLTGVPSMWNKVSILDKSGERRSVQSIALLSNALNATSVDAVLAALAMPGSPHPPPTGRPPTSCPAAGTGFTLQMDTAFLYSSDSFSFTTAAAVDPLAPFPCVGALCASRPNVTAPQVGC